MKGFFFLIGLLITIAFLQAQTPDSWTGDAGIETFQENTIVYGGLFSCGVIVKTDQQQNCDLINTLAIEVSEGNDFYLTFQAYTSQHVRISAFLDWVGAQGTLSGVYVGPATNGWTKFEFSSSVPTGATAVTLRLRFYDVNGFVAPETQYIDDVKFESPIGEPLTVANGDFESWPTTKPEPSNYPMDFAATVVGLDAVLSWTDATGETMPDAYLILISTQNNIPNPIDSVYIADDLNLSDNHGAANVLFGEQTFTFSGLQPLTNYYLKIFPYTNAGTNINFKTDATVPAAFVQTTYVVTILNENFDENWDGWEVLNITGDQEWDRNNNWGIEETACAHINGFANGNPYQNEDWLISPAMNLENFNFNWVSFYLSIGFPTSIPQITVKMSSDYDGGGNPAIATWTTLNPVLPNGNPDFVWTYSGNLNISAFTGNIVHLAFVYESNTSQASIWRVDNLLITGESIFLPEPTNYPTFFNAAAVQQNITLSWNDATGMVVPAGYLIKTSIQNNISLPYDGIPVPDDTDLSDGQGAINVTTGIENFAFTNLAANTAYFFTIFPFSNSGAQINYKTDSLPPQTQAITLPLPEPSNYPTDFDAIDVGLDAAISWSDATGETMPDAYLILISTQNNIQNPVDSVYIADDLNLSDNLGAANVMFGVQKFTFTGLQPLTNYYFKIFPYTNAGTNINYKTDATVPAAFIQTSYVATILDENFDENWDGWEVLNITGDQEWDRNNTWGIEQTACANINGFANGNPYQNEDWLISPAINLENYFDNWVSFYLAVGVTSTLPQLTVKISADYDGGGNPATATWTTLNPDLPAGNPEFVWTYSGNINISAFTGNIVHLAFVYESNATQASTWRVDDILITGESIFLPEPTNYPTFFTATPAEQHITLTWNDAAGIIVPAGYLIKASNQNNISLPIDGTPEPDDTDLTDGQAAVNVPYGVKSFCFSGLSSSSSFYFSIFPFINSGENIDFKTGDSPPVVTATTLAPPIEEVFLSAFDQSWENWQLVNIAGDQSWDRNNTSGIGATSCALISGNVGTFSENEDWLISPAINLTNFTNEKLSFFSALESSETELKVKISTDYDGSENPGSFTWNEISDQALWPEADSLMNWGYSGQIDIADFGADTLFVAFVFNYFGSEPASCKIDNILIVGENHTGVEENNCEDGVIVFPNPANGVFTINMEKPYIQVEVYSTTGIYLLTKPISENQLQIDLSQLPVGFYFLKFANEKSGLFFTKKIEIN